MQTQANHKNIISSVINIVKHEGVSFSFVGIVNNVFLGFFFL